MSGGEELDELDRHFATLPSMLLPYGGPPFTEEQIAEFRERFAAILASPAAARKARRATLRANLSRRTRLRLWWTRRVDSAAYWLVCHDHADAARRLYQVTGLWGRRR